MDMESYLTERVNDQIKYFDSKAIRSQRLYKWLRGTAIFCNISTTLAIALTFIVPPDLRGYMGITALALSTIVLATYQIEEFYNFGTKWEKFRLVAEYLKSEKYLFLNEVGIYSSGDTDEKKHLFIEIMEGILRGTDMSYFSSMVEPGKGIEKRLQ